MEVSVSNQAFIFLCFVLGGFTIGLVYDFVKSLQEISKNKIITFTLDIAFWVIVAIIIFVLLFVTNDGELRWYEFLGTIIGIVLYNMLLSRIVTIIYLSIFTFIINVIYYIIIVPVIYIVKFILFPIKLIAKLINWNIKAAGKKARIIDNKLFMITKKASMFKKKI